MTGVLLLHIRAHLSTANPFDTSFQTFIKHLLCPTLSRKPKKLPAQLSEAAAAPRPTQSRIDRVAEPKNFAKRSKEGAGVARPRYSPIRSGYGDKNSKARAERCANRKVHVRSMFDRTAGPKNFAARSKRGSKGRKTQALSIRRVAKPQRLRGAA